MPKRQVNMDCRTLRQVHGFTQERAHPLRGGRAAAQLRDEYTPR
jgi:hypothetical protein